MDVLHRARNLTKKGTATTGSRFRWVRSPLLTPPKAHSP